MSANGSRLFMERLLTACKGYVRLMERHGCISRKVTDIWQKKLASLNLLCKLLWRRSAMGDKIGHTNCPQDWSLNLPEELRTKRASMEHFQLTWRIVPVKQHKVCKVLPSGRSTTSSESCILDRNLKNRSTKWMLKHETWTKMKCVNSCFQARRVSGSWSHSQTWSWQQRRMIFHRRRQCIDMKYPGSIKDIVFVPNVPSLLQAQSTFQQCGSCHVCLFITKLGMKYRHSKEAANLHGSLEIQHPLHWQKAGIIHFALGADQ